MKKLAIVGASYLQNPLIERAKALGVETHVFAWQIGDVGEKTADYFYPISIVEKEKILTECQRISIDGIISIASDLAIVTVNYVADKMGLIGNSIECTSKSTNKHKMRQCFEDNGDPSPKSIKVKSITDIDTASLSYPIIVKPLDRSGSRGITKLYDSDNLENAIEWAKKQGFEKSALIEEFVEGREYSVEYISWKGRHTFLAITKKYTTGSPNFIETGHMIPAGIDIITETRVKNIIEHALTSLGIMYGASHSEIKIDANGEIKIIEIGARMGGDNIGSSLVELSTGYDFLKAVIETALGIEPAGRKTVRRSAAIRFIMTQDDVADFDDLRMNHPELIIAQEIHPVTDDKVLDSASRFGYFMLLAEKPEDIELYMPMENK